MHMRVKKSIALAILCMLLALPFQGCGATTQGARNSSDLKIMFSKHAAPATLVSDIRDTRAINRLYEAALALPAPKSTLMSCPADDTGLYHLTFSGANYREPHMDIKASGCRILTLTDSGETRMMDDAFVSLFTSTAGLTSLDPTFP